MDLRITGIDQVQRALKELPDRVVVGAFAKALSNGAGVIAAEVETRAAALGETGTDTPLFEHVKVQVEVDAGKRGGIASVGFDQTQDERSGKPQDLKALWVEVGHVMLTHDKKPPKQGLQHVPPHPFMRPAFEASADKATAVFGDTLIDSLGTGAASYEGR